MSFRSQKWSPMPAVTPHATNMNPLAGRVGVVTGASSGIGRAVAVALAARGVRVCAVGRNAVSLEKTVAAAAEGSDIRTFQADLTSDDQISRLADWVGRSYGAVDVLVHSAGIMRHAPLRDALLGNLDAQYRANVRGPYALTKSLLPMLKASQGQLVFINSSRGLNANQPEIGQYAATKHAFKAIADSLREEVNRDGVRVLTVYPGRTATAGLEELYGQKGTPYEPGLLLQPADVAQIIICALSLPRTAEVTDLSIRPMIKSY
jgi:NADP-dependent 3-hydroxy acid dehydrogenase YdfG